MREYEKRVQEIIKREKTICRVGSVLHSPTYNTSGTLSDDNIKRYPLEIQRCYKGYKRFLNRV